MDPYIKEFLEIRKHCDGAYVPDPPNGPRAKCFQCGTRTKQRTQIMNELPNGDYEPGEVLPCCLECESRMMEV